MSSSTCAVAHAAGEHVMHGSAVHQLAALRSIGGAPAPWLEPEEARVRGRNANRAAAVVGTRRRHDTRCDRRGAATAGPPRRVLAVPGIARRSPRVRLGDALGTKLRRVGHAERNQTAGEPAARDSGVLVGRPARALECRVAPTRRDPLVVLEQVLEQERNAREGTRQRALAALARNLVEGRDDCVELGIDCFDPLHGGGEQLARADGFAANQLRKPSRVVCEVICL